MIDICYYNSQVKEELDGAADYVKRAITCKKDHPEWASTYMKMADAELDHASNLMRIFEEDYKQNKKDDPLYEQIHASLNDMYSEFAANVKYMQQIYSNK